MVAKELLNMVDQFLKCEYDAIDFSYIFPDKLIELNVKLEKENKKLYELLNDDIPDLCGNFEPYEPARRGYDFLLDEKQFKEKVKIIYEKALKLM